MPIKLITYDSRSVKPIKQYLEQNNLLNKSYKIQKHDDRFEIFTNLSEITEELTKYEYEMYLQQETKLQEITLDSVIKDFLDLKHISIPDSLTIPKRWSIYPPMILFNTNTFEAKPWQELFNNISREEFFKFILSHQQDIFGTHELTHIAVNKPIIETDIMRRPFNVLPLYGDFGPIAKFDNPTETDFNYAFWCHVIQNGIYQTWAPKYTMFSRGNIKEKKRILENYKNLNNTIVVDFYCGIGYFSLSYLKNGAKLLCWELNPWSVEGFTRALKHADYRYVVIREADKFSYEEYLELNVDAIIFLESNENIPKRLSSFPENSLPISHMNLGLLPSSKLSWNIADQLKEKCSMSTTLHIHENVHIDQFVEIKNEIKQTFEKGEILHLEKVKTFAPDVWHVVIDVKNKK
ncbi:tRNA wybutosine-synthesizing protein 2 [Spathaspora sp. JA1]|nr:tRNA wybutosine-synthesizing protein 2 [Spathaspora sp. JA1]